MYNKQASFWDRVTTGESDDDFIRRRGVEGQRAGHITGGIGGGVLGATIGGALGGGFSSGSLRSRILKGAVGAIGAGTIGAIGGRGFGGMSGQARGVRDAIAGDTGVSTRDTIFDGMEGALGGGVGGLVGGGDKRLPYALGGAALGAVASGMGSIGTKAMAKYISPDANVTREGLGTEKDYYRREALRSMASWKDRIKKSSVRGLSSHYLCGY